MQHVAINARDIGKQPAQPVARCKGRGANRDHTDGHAHHQVPPVHRVPDFVQRILPLLRGGKQLQLIHARKRGLEQVQEASFLPSHVLTIVSYGCMFASGRFTLFHRPLRC